ncbi:hypothetical protein [Pseudomonas sp. B21-010]|uniref:hypothetical protein n=1 Tax=Pseudomonas sp. B21-010 TaxID=2895471 RepID=UPI00215FB0BB|nr:hypothetical protein [Pseudomonas sp. B21-010]UVM59123.1 hypothetical protein LOY50_16300 [Pseudomonas sp. B21-010]
MKRAIHCGAKPEHASYDEQVVILMGYPLKITFTIEPPDDHVQLKNPLSPSVRPSQIAARIETSKGFIFSDFLMTSEIKDNSCVILTNYNYADSALLDHQPVSFIKQIRMRKERRKGGVQLPDTLNRFHHWLASQISENLMLTGYLSNLHEGAKINFIRLEKPPKTQKNRENCVDS